MKKIKYFSGILIYALLIVTIFSCEKEDNLLSKNDIGINNRSIDNANPYQNEHFGNLARVLSVGVSENSDLRNLLKSEALLQEDDDYNILLNKIKNRIVQTNNGPQTLIQYLGNIYSHLNISASLWNGEGNSNGGPYNINYQTVLVFPPNNPSGVLQIANPNDIIPFLITVYPYLQISIPVHAENWNANTYSPICTYIPDNFDEQNTTAINAYSNGSTVLLNVSNVPTNPVVVVSLSERLPDNAVQNLNPPSGVTIALTGTQVNQGISLTWTVTNPNNEQIIGYYIYRKKLGQTDFVLWGQSQGNNNTTYIDPYLDAYYLYYYYIVAYNANGVSPASNIVSVVAPPIPSDGQSFKAHYLYDNHMELRWTYPSGQYYSYAKLYKLVVGIDNDYQLVGEFPNTIKDFIDNNVIKGKRVNYRIAFYNQQNQPSNPLYDFVIVPYRNVGEQTPLKINFISWDYRIYEVEHWINGKPEFRISVAKVGQSGVAAVVQKGIEEKPFNSMYFADRFIFNWMPADWAETLTFSVIEYDRGPKIDLNIDAGFNFKDSSNTYFLNGSAKVTFEDITNTADDDCKLSDHRYFDKQNAILEMPVGGVKLHLKN